MKSGSRPTPGSRRSIEQCWRTPMASENEVAFPTLDAKDLAALAARGHSRKVHAGEVLFAEGDRNRSFFVVLEGAIEIVGHSKGVPHVVAVHHPGQFSGDVDMLSGRAIL